MPPTSAKENLLSESSQEMIKMIVDIDTGVDDAHALMLALADDRVEILAITCVSGNTTLDNVIINTLRVLDLCNRLDIPVYRGASRSWMGNPSPETGFHGLDGMGDTESWPVDTSLIKDEPAANAMVRLVNENPGEVVLFAVAPLTNLALAIRLDPEFGNKLKSTTIMGGNINARGNYKTAGEFNFSADPEAAHVVLQELGCHITIVTLEVSLDHGMSLDWFDNWQNIDTKRGRFNKRIMKHIMVNKQKFGIKKMVLYDGLAMVVVLQPECVLETEERFCTVEVQGEFTKGMLVVDWKNHLGKKPNVHIVTKLNTDIIERAFERSMKVE